MDFIEQGGRWRHDVIYTCVIGVGDAGSRCEADANVTSETDSVNCSRCESEECKQLGQLGFDTTLATNDETLSDPATNDVETDGGYRPSDVGQLSTSVFTFDVDL